MDKARHLKPAETSIFTPVPRDQLGNLEPMHPVHAFKFFILYRTVVHMHIIHDKSFRFCLDSILASPVTHSCRSGARPAARHLFLKAEYAGKTVHLMDDLVLFEA